MTATQSLDLSFEDRPLISGKRISAQQIDQYNRRGYIQPFDIFDQNEVSEIRQYIGRLMEDAGKDGAYGINCYQARLAGLWDIACDARILDCVEDLIGPDILCWATAILSKKPHDPKRVPWHQDACFWHLNPARTVTVWLAIDDVDEDNSAMMFIPGTHRLGPISTSEADSGSVFHKETAGADGLGQPFVNRLKAGQISLHADMLVHGSAPNQSERRRCGLTLRYCPPFVRIVDDSWARGVEAIMCRGHDPTGYWRHHPRPNNDDIRKTTSPHVVGNN